MRLSFWTLLIASFFVISLSTSCVSKGRYMVSLQEQATVQSTLKSKSVDYADAQAKVQYLESALYGLKIQIAELNEAASNSQKTNQADQIQLGNALNLSQIRLDSVRAELNDTKQIVEQYEFLAEAKESELKKLSDLIRTATQDVPGHQKSLRKQANGYAVYFDQGLFFKDQVEISPFGEALLQRLAFALDQVPNHDLHIISNTPRSVQTKDAWLNNSLKSNALAQQLVFALAISPDRVTAASKLGPVISNVAAPAERVDRHDIAFVFKLPTSTF